MYTPIVGALGYILSPDGSKTLLVYRNARENDQHFGKYNGLGGKMVSGEDTLTCLIREVEEEAGIVCQDVQLRGIINWTGFGTDGENWLGLIFLVKKFSGTPYLKNEEGSLDWHHLDDLVKLPMWEGDRHFLPLVFDGDKRIFHGYMPYHDGKPVGWKYVRM